MVRDRLWIWTHPVGSHDYIDPGDGRTFRSQMTPVGGAEYLGLPNVYFVQYDDNPPVQELASYAADLQAVERVVWSLTAGGGGTSAEMRDEVLRLARKYPNIEGFVLDDFLHFDTRMEGPDPWLAENNVTFPVSLVVTLSAPRPLTGVELTQTSWPTGDYVSGECVMDVTRDGREWQEAWRGTLPREPGAMTEVQLSGEEAAAVRVRILSTHDTDKAMSCGLGRVRLWDRHGPVPSGDLRAEASSTYSERFVAANVLVAPTVSDGPVPASMTPDELAALRERAVIDGRRKPIVCVVYTHQLSARIRPHIDQVDKIALWTWRQEDLVSLEANLARMEAIAPGKPIVLGCYMFDYGNNRPMGVANMERQCELGLRWLREGRIEGMIFLASNVCDAGLETVEWTRRWIASVGDGPLGGR